MYFGFLVKVCRLCRWFGPGLGNGLIWLPAPLEQCASIEYDCPELAARIRSAGSAPRRVAGFMADSSAAYSESTPVLKDRLKRAGFEDAQVETIASSVKTLKNLAFISSYSPGQADDAPLMEVLSSLLSEPDLSIALKSSWRAAFHEAYAVVTAELKQQVERSEEVQVRTLTQPERAERYEKQVKRLSGVNIKGSSEPSERLVDVCVAIYERNQLQYVPWSRCSSREQEAQNESRKEVKLALDGSGKVKVDSASKEVVADTSTEVLVMQALQRRALAMEQANIVSYTLLDLWHQRLMKARLTDPPPGYSRPSFDQLRLADQKLFSELQDETRSGIQALSSGRPVDNLIKDVMHRAEVSSLLLPLPAPSVASIAKSSATAPPPQPTWKGNGKGKGKLKGKTGRMGTPRMPAELEGCKAYTQKGKPLCYDFNMSHGCSRPVKNNECQRGLHNCAWPGCGGAHSASSCPKRTGKKE